VVRGEGVQGIVNAEDREIMATQGDVQGADSPESKVDRPRVCVSGREGLKMVAVSGDQMLDVCCLPELLGVGDDGGSWTAKTLMMSCMITGVDVAELCICSA